MRLHFPLLLLFVCTLFFAPEVFGQTQDTRDDRAALLPDIDAQDIEIRGDFRARFPGISRQPILGFSPTPRVFRIDPNRLPFMETPEEVMASFPLSQLEPNLGPERQLTEIPQQSLLYATAGFGNYVSPEAKAYFSLPLSDRMRLSGNLDWLSSEGHLEEGSVAGAFRRAQGEATLSTRLTTNGNLLASVRGRSDFADLQDRLFNTVPIDLYVIDGRSSFDKLGASLGWVSQRSVHDRFEAFVHYDRSTFESSAERERFRPRTGYRAEADEHRFGAQSAFSWAGRQIGHVFLVEAEFDAALYETKAGWFTDVPLADKLERDWFVAGAAAYWQNELFTGDRLKAGVRFFSGHDPVQEATFMVYPYVNWQYRRTGSLEMEAEVSGYMRNSGLEPLVKGNRTLAVPNSLQNERTFYGNFQASYRFDALITATAGLHAAYTLRPVMYAPNAQFDGSTSWVQPEDLFLIRPSVGAALNLRPRLLTLYADAHYNITEMSKAAIPTAADTDTFAGLENYRITAGVRSTPFEHANISLWADLIGTRKALVAETAGDGFFYRNTGSVFLLNARAEYRIDGRIGFYLKTLNMLNQSYEIWDGYQERGIQVFGGLSVRL
ncbi:hypothetical protein CYPRO_1341 [Cyclonatronum proteinivorum]|uniref:TonB dependent receptor n=1 Tax=Cyclonatronum proteinivorum TaxID=1457365 RepID=A0A345UJE5_9BACT|nr:hypothetical protein [Cyclonatronum proteinivorum]AXJ00597.1 hypothetical protein CYPRO_1341 [Cyclonatronum proteinivorum]